MSYFSRCKCRIFASHFALKDTMKRAKSLEKRIADRIAHKQGEVFMRKDFTDLSSDYDQVGRALRHLVSKGKVVKIGHGLYAKATTSPLSGRVVPRRGIGELATEALRRLSVEVMPSSYDRAYNDGHTTQVPTGRVIAVKGRVARKIGYDGKFVTFERAH
jgi:Family of unknown function (DUF6088)